MSERLDPDAWDPRHWVSSLVDRVPEGDRGEPAHEVGAEVEVSQPVTFPEFDEQVAIPAPRLSVILLRQAIRRAYEAEDLKCVVLASVTEPSPGGRGFPEGVMLRGVGDTQSLYRYLEAAAAVVCLSLAVLEAFTAEQIPRDFVYNDGLTKHDHDGLMRFGLEMRLSKVMSQALGRSNPYGTELWTGFVRLKGLRDNVHHLKLPQIYGLAPDVTIAHRLLNADVVEHARTASLMMAHYGLDVPDSL